MREGGSRAGDTLIRNVQTFHKLTHSAQEGTTRTRWRGLEDVGGVTAPLMRYCDLESRLLQRCF